MFQAPRGTTDLLPEEQKYWRFIESKAMALARRYGYGRIDTPVFEDSDLFIRSVGEGTDIVEKEMYTFEDRGGDSVTLRPEGTAPFAAHIWSTDCITCHSRCGCTTSALFSATSGLRQADSVSTISLALKLWATGTPRWTPR